MGSRAVRVAAVVAAVSVVLVGCAGGADVDSSESPLVLPSAPSQSATPSEGGVLDLESMSDEELLAEAKRAYQGWLDDMESVHAAESDDYLAIDEWATPEYLSVIQKVYVDDRPHGYRFRGGQELAQIELIDRPEIDASRFVSTAVCVDNIGMEIVDDSGNAVDRGEEVRYSVGEAYFSLAEDESHLRLYSETELADGTELQCGAGY